MNNMIATVVSFILVLLVTESAPMDLYAYEGDGLSLRCSGYGQIDWFKDGMKLEPDYRISIDDYREDDSRGTDLYISNVRVDDSGTYICRRNGVVVDTYNYIVTGYFNRTQTESSAEKSGISVPFLVTSVSACVYVLK